MVLRYFMSPRTSYRSRRLFLKSPLTHFVAAPLQIEPAALGFDLVLGTNLKAVASIVLRCSRPRPPWSCRSRCSKSWGEWDPQKKGSKKRGAERLSFCCLPGQWSGGPAERFTGPGTGSHASRRRIPPGPDRGQTAAPPSGNRPESPGQCRS